MTFWACVIGTISFFPLMVWEYIKNPGWFALLDYRGWTGIIYGAVFSSALAYGASDWALSKLTAFRTSIFSYLDPVVAIAVAIPLLGEKITVPFVVGSILVFTGIYIAENRVHWHPIWKLFSIPKL
jgi:drug/metabolite transporter (DMT)-like permease